MVSPASVPNYLPTAVDPEAGQKMRVRCRRSPGFLSFLYFATYISIGRPSFLRLDLSNLPASEHRGNGKGAGKSPARAKATGRAGDTKEETGGATS
jgi:hypothetical protein